MPALPLMIVVALLGTSPPTVSDATKDERGILIHRVQSPYQAGTTEVRVLLPSKPAKESRLPVVYVLPVEAGRESHYGDGLVEIQRLGLHETAPAIFVAPTFAQLPWYADHPTDAEVRQESHLLEVVLPFVERQYPVRTEPGGRLLLGFSKSGWGAVCLLLRHPGLFGKAAAWDAPLMMDRPGLYGSGPIFGTVENFEQYRVSALLKQHAGSLGDRPRLIVMGYDNFRSELAQAHALMNELKIPHAYEDGPKRAHRWESGWIPEAVSWLLRDAPRPDPRGTVVSRLRIPSEPRKPDRDLSPRFPPNSFPTLRVGTRISRS